MIDYIGYILRGVVVAVVGWDAGNEDGGGSDGS